MTTDTLTHIEHLVSSYVGAKVSEQTVVMYVARLSEIPADELGAAIDACLDTCKFFPTIAEIKAAHTELFGRQIRNAYEVLKAPPKSAHHLLHDGERLVG